MTDKKNTAELNEAELDQVTGGASIGDLKPGLTEKAGIRVGKRADGVGVRAIKKGDKGFSSTGSANPTV